MKTKNELNKQIAKLQEELFKLEEADKLKLEEPLIIETKTKEFRIYKWSKQVKEFNIPKGFELAEEGDFIDFYDNNLIKLEKYPVVYFTKNRSKKNIKNGWGLSRLCLGGYLDLYSNNGDLASSDDYGRVVVVKERKE